MAFSSWFISNILGILLVMVLAMFLYGIFTEVFAAAASGSDPRITTMGPCIAAGLVASLIGGFLTARLRAWLETE
jgi:hypothetical protein